MRKPYRCTDGFCGGLDCARCYPETWWQDEAYLDACDKADDAHNNVEDRDDTYQPL
jgi:hypothetical protein